MHQTRDFEAGFTLIEFLVLILAVAALVTIGLVNVRNVRAHHRDRTSKSNINTIDYYLESFYEKNGYYPPSADPVTLKGIDVSVLKDKNGLAVNASGSVYIYRPHDCTEGKCKSFDLQATLEKEALFVKPSLNS